MSATKMRVQIERGSTGPRISISGLPDMRCKDVHHIFSPIVEHCCKTLTVNELKKVVSAVDKQLAALDPDDIPASHSQIANEVRDVLAKRQYNSRTFPIPFGICLEKSNSGRGMDIHLTRLPGAQVNSRDYIFANLVEHCSKDLSTNELRKIIIFCLKHKSDSILINQLKKVIQDRTGTEPKFLPTLTATITRGSPGGSTITVGGLVLSSPRCLDGKYDIYDSIVDYGCEALSLDQVRQVLWDLEDKLSKKHPDDIPLCYVEMLDELKKVILKRRDRGETKPKR